MSAPAVSVVMTVYNGEPWLGAAVDSILGQTFRAWELIVIDDGSTDDSPQTLARRPDPRLRIVWQPRAGQTASLNRALRLARAPLIARMDADDVALSERLGRQVEWLGVHPEIGLLGTGCHEIAPDATVLRTIRPPADDGSIRRALIRANPFIHSSVMFRRNVLDQVGTYDERFVVAQDYDLWLRMSRVTSLAILPDPLVLRRVVPGQLSSARDTTRLRDEVVVKARALARGDYPWWDACFLVKPLAGLAVPRVLRQRLRLAIRSGTAHAR